MSGLNVRKDACELDLLSLGALVHRLDPGVIPFRKARSFEIHVSGGEYNVAANLSDCFGLRTGIATAMVVPGDAELTVKDPPRSRTRSRIPANPTPVGESSSLNRRNRSGGMPFPLSLTSR